MLKTALAFTLFSTSLFPYCVAVSCDNSISYAIGRYSEKRVKRIEDYKRTITTTTSMEKVLHRIESDKLLELLKERAKLIEMTQLISRVNRENKNTKIEP